MPAQSPTLSPTLSAITAGLRGSSSGMPASILPTMSAPTSAPLVKMPPPEPGEDGDERAAEAEPDERVDRLAGRLADDPGEDPVVAGDADERQPDDEQAGDRAAAEGDRQGLGSRPPRAASATRVLARTETFMPTKPAPADSAAPIRNPIATRMFCSGIRMMKTTTPTAAMIVYWRVRYAEAPSCTAAEIDCIRSLPGDSASSAREVTTP